MLHQKFWLILGFCCCSLFTFRADFSEAFIGSNVLRVTAEVQMRRQTQSIRETATKVTDASNPMNVARVIITLVFCTFFTASYFTNKVN